MFVPYRPSDYNGLLDEFYEAERKREAHNVALETVYYTGKI